MWESLRPFILKANLSQQILREWVQEGEETVIYCQLQLFFLKYEGKSYDSGIRPYRLVSFPFFFLDLNVSSFLILMLVIM